MRRRQRQTQNARMYWCFFALAAVMTAGLPIRLLLGRESNGRADAVSVASTTRTARVTAYCGCSVCCPGSDDGITASGYRIRPGAKLVAAPASIPFGTVVIIPGYGTATVRDRGILIDDTVDQKTIKVNGKYVTRKTADFDVFFFDHQDAKNWGVKTLTVTTQER
jgi:3D (Asp-Asp-Asp) domain-containing protein